MAGVTLAEERAYQAKWHREAYWKKIGFCLTPLGRLMSHTDRGDGCWEWTGSKDHNGYGQVKLNGYFLAHRAVYSFLRGPIPTGLTLDHLCRNTSCVNPDHLQPVTLRVNSLRGTSFAARRARATHCEKGHAWDAANTAIQRGRYGPYRRCRTCRRISQHG